MSRRFSTASFVSHEPYIAPVSTKEVEVYSGITHRSPVGHEYFSIPPHRPDFVGSSVCNGSGFCGSTTGSGCGKTRFSVGRNARGTDTGNPSFATIKTRPSWYSQDKVSARMPPTEMQNF